MKKRHFVALVVALATAGALVGPRATSAQIQVNIGVKVPLPPLPHFVFRAPPAVVVVPGTYVYAAPDVDIDIVYYHGYWYRPHHDRWYRAASYNGSWMLLGVAQVPRDFAKLSPGFRSVSPDRERLSYQKVRKNWKQWEKEKYWDSDSGRAEEGRGDKGKGHKGKGHKN